jgi:SET family sugar efflux transporter-like MFS transporter
MSEISPIRALRDSPDLRRLLLATVILGVSHAFVMPFMSLFGVRAAKMSSFGFGVFMTTVSLSGIVLSTALSRYSDLERSRKPILVLGGLAGAVGYVGYAFLRDPLLLTICGALFIGVSSVTFSQLFAYTRDLLGQHHTAPAQIPLYMNVFRSAFALAWTAGPAIAAWIMASYSFTGTFLVAATCLLLFAVVVQRALPEVGPSVSPRLAGALPSLFETLRQPAIFGAFVAFVAYFVASTMGIMNLPLLLVETMGKSEREVGIAYSVAPFFELPLMYYVGVLATRIRHDRMIGATFLLGAAYYLTLSSVTSPYQVYGAQVVSALIVSVTGGVAITYFQDFLPGQTGTATNLYSSASRVGSTAGYLAFGLIGDAFGHRIVFVVCAGLCLLSAGLLAFLRPATAAA